MAREPVDGDILIFTGHVSFRKTVCIDPGYVLAVYTGGGYIVEIEGTLVNPGHVQWQLKQGAPFRVRVHNKEFWITVTACTVDLLSNKIKVSGTCGHIASRN